MVSASLDSSAAVGVNKSRPLIPDGNSAGVSGAVYIYTRENGSWSEQAFIKASNAGRGDWFGSSIALSENRLVVGAIHEESASTGVNGLQGDNSAAFSGAAYIFDRSGTTWTQQAYLKASNSERYDSFGSAVSVFGNTVAVAAVNKDTETINTGLEDDGAVYVFEQINNQWSQQAYLQSETDDSKNFGNAVVLYEDTLAVSSSYSEHAVYLYGRDNDGWRKQAIVTNGDYGSDFGFSIDLYRDSLIVGVPYDDGDTSGINGENTSVFRPSSGAAYIFSRQGENWIQQAYIKASHPDTGDRFGTVVTISEGSSAVAAPYEAGLAAGVGLNEDDIPGTHLGAVYVFQ